VTGQPTGSDVLDVVVIGAGQAGLAMGYHLARRGQRFVILDAGAEIGHVWRARWDSLRLFTPSQYDDLPGMPFPATRGTYPGKDDVADYLQAYATAFDLPVRVNMDVTSLARGDGLYLVRAGGEVLEASHVVVAAGPFHVPFIPPLSKGLDLHVVQIHSVSYRSPESLPAGRVLVVGAANSGCQIAAELSASNTVDLSAGQRIPTIPQRPLGRDIWSWAKAIGLDRVTVDSRLGRRLEGRDQVIGAGPRELVRQHGVQIRPRVMTATGRSVTFADGSTCEYDGVLWATGFTTDYCWIDVPGVRDEGGRLLHHRGVTASAGLYTLGLSWQHTRGSTLLGWVGADAAFLAEQIAPTSDEPMIRKPPSPCVA
jgi:putative flavoprotein involved in K+ transport